MNNKPHDKTYKLNGVVITESTLVELNQAIQESRAIPTPDTVRTLKLMSLLMQMDDLDDNT